MMRNVLLEEHGKSRSQFILRPVRQVNAKTGEVSSKFIADIPSSDGFERKSLKVFHNMYAFMHLIVCQFF